MLVPSFFGENLFDDFFDDFYRPMERRPAPQQPAGRGPLMKTDVHESDTGYELETELPGYKKDDVQVQLKDGVLTIRASKKASDDEKDQNGRYIRRERFTGNCSRSFYVGDDLKQQDIKAKFEDGVLKITIPKKDAKPQVEESKYIAID